MALSFVNNLVGKLPTESMSNKCTIPTAQVKSNNFGKAFTLPQALTGNLSNIASRLTQTISSGIGSNAGLGSGVANLGQALAQLKLNQIAQVGNLATGALSTVTGGLGGASANGGLGNIGNVVTGALSTVTGGLGGTSGVNPLGALGNIGSVVTNTLSSVTGSGSGNPVALGNLGNLGNVVTGALSAVTGGLGGAGTPSGLGNIGNVVTGALSTVSGGLGGNGGLGLNNLLSGLMGGVGGTNSIGTLGGLGNGITGTLSNLTTNLQGSSVTAGSPQAGMIGLGNSLSANNTGMLGVGGLVGGAASAVGIAAGGVAQGTHHLAERVIDFSGLGPVFGPLVDDTLIHPLLWDPISMATGVDVSKHPEGVPDVSNPLNVKR